MHTTHDDDRWQLWELLDARQQDPWRASRWYVDLGVAPLKGALELVPGMANRIGGGLQEAEEWIVDCWDDRLEVEAGWPTRTDADRVEAAFAHLAESAGFHTEIGWGCCLTCGGTRSCTEVGVLPSAVIHVSGLMFDARGYLLVDHGVVNTPELQYGPGPFKQSRTIVDALRAEGLEVEWEEDRRYRHRGAGLEATYPFRLAVGEA